MFFLYTYLFPVNACKGSENCPHPTPAKMKDEKKKEQKNNSKIISI